MHPISIRCAQSCKDPAASSRLVSHPDHQPIARKLPCTGRLNFICCTLIFNSMHQFATQLASNATSRIQEVAACHPGHLGLGMQSRQPGQLEDPASYQLHVMSPRLTASACMFRSMPQIRILEAQVHNVIYVRFISHAPGSHPIDTNYIVDSSRTPD